MPSVPEELHSINQILHLTHHRNKNQHRLAKWWKSFSMLRRNLSKLFKELETNLQYTALSPKNKKTVESREIVERRVRFLEDVLMERCYVAFGGLVADNQYAALGLMLIGTLARARKIIGPLRGQVMAGEREGEKIGDRIVEVERQHQDLGEVIRREDVVSDERPDILDQHGPDGAAGPKRLESRKRSVAAAETKSTAAAESISMKGPKRKRKKGDAFDDLFAGLV
ncbi:RNA-processing rmp1 [Hyphodiscus hymeniophilus]|uniref:RNA-processing rmp1 n=1 Tax=Hyphodiscus hymeniophilus TaxID=353542 RepID=A0A9P7AWB9_9HELO|nr:RNA-processing rmp1 [Hyphodiscus hymeniophilus]